MHSTYTAEACGPPSSGPEFPASRGVLANPDEFHHYSEPTAIAYFDGVTLNGGILCPPSPIRMPACLLCFLSVFHVRDVCLCQMDQQFR